MPRSGWRKSESDRRLPDLVSVGLLMKVFPAEVVDAVISACGRTEQRRRSLPARSMAYFAMGMALHSEGSYEDVLALISDGLAWAHRQEGSGKLANKAAISHARDRLGPEPMALLFERVAKPLAAEDTPGCWLAGRRLVAIDGTCLDLPATAANDSHFGRPGVMRGERCAFPQARVVALAECGTHAMFEAVIGPYTTSEAALSVELLGRLRPGMLCLADRGFYCFTAWENACRTGADLLWRVKDNLILDPVKALPDGSFLADVFHSTTDRARRHPARVRVISYTIEDGRDPAGPYRLITTLLDHRKAPAAQLAAAYAQRWEIETAFDELKTHQRGPRAVLRSKSPKVATRAIWGHVVCLLPRRRPRANPRVVKRQYTKWHVKRSRPHDWPQPSRLPEQAVVI